MKLLLLAALIALAACAPPPSSVPLGPPMCIVQDGDTIREIPCPQIVSPGHNHPLKWSLGLWKPKTGRHQPSRAQHDR